MDEKQYKWDESFKTGRDYSPMNVILLNSLLTQVKNKKVAIDLGCGTGDGVIKLAKQSMTVTGIDWSPNALEKTRTRAREAGVIDKITLVECDLDHLSDANLEKYNADIILCKLVIAFINDKKNFLECAKSFLNNDGLIFLQTPVLHDSIEYNEEDKPGIAVKYSEFNLLLKETFTYTTEFNHSYYSEKGDLVTYLLKK